MFQLAQRKSEPAGIFRLSAIGNTGVVLHYRDLHDIRRSLADACTCGNFFVENA